MDYQRFFEEAIDQIHAERRYRVFADIERIVGKFPRAVWRAHGEAREITVWCSNDYLGMGQNPGVIAAMQQAAGSMGAGAGGTRNISGTNHPLVELEMELAELHGKEAALVFTSGFVSNEAAISTIARLLPNCLILSDELNHSSMIEGVRRSGATTETTPATNERPATPPFGMALPLPSASVTTVPPIAAVPLPIALNRTTATSFSPLVASLAPPNVATPATSMLAWNGPPGHCDP